MFKFIENNNYIYIYTILNMRTSMNLLLNKITGVQCQSQRTIYSTIQISDPDDTSAKNFFFKISKKYSLLVF